MKRVIVITTLSALGFAACGSDSGSGSGEAFCDAARIVKSIDQESPDSLYSDDFIGALRTFAASSSGDDADVLTEIADSIDAVNDVAATDGSEPQDLGDLPPEAQEALGTLFELMDSDRVNATLDAVNARAKDECDIDLES